MTKHHFQKSTAAALFLGACLLDTSGAAWADAAFTDACNAAGGEVYSVKGNVKTINASPTTQIGTIKLALSESGDKGDTEFKAKGNLVGTITGGSLGMTLLSHTAQFFGDDDDAGDFVTVGDKAVITGVRAVDALGVPCSFFVDESITEIASGSGFFADVPSVNIKAKGFIAFCAEENRNEFKLTGEICVK